MAHSVPWDLLGIAVSGDIGPYTVWTDRFGRKVPFLKSPPKEPCSPAQAALRATFSAAQAEWAALPRWEKAVLEEACRLTSIPLTGQNLWIHCRMKDDWSAYQTIAEQSGLTLPPHSP